MTNLTIMNTFFMLFLLSLLPIVNSFFLKEKKREGKQKIFPQLHLRKMLGYCPATASVCHFDKRNQYMQQVCWSKSAYTHV